MSIKNSLAAAGMSLCIAPAVMAETTVAPVQALVTSSTNATSTTWAVRADFLTVKACLDMAKSEIAADSNPVPLRGITPITITHVDCIESNSGKITRISADKFGKLQITPLP